MTPSQNVKVPEIIDEVEQTPASEDLLVRHAVIGGSSLVDVSTNFINLVLPKQGVSPSGVDYDHNFLTSLLQDLG